HVDRARQRDTHRAVARVTFLPAHAPTRARPRVRHFDTRARAVRGVGLMRAQREHASRKHSRKEMWPERILLGPHGTPYGIRTRVTRMRTWRPGPLDERGKSTTVLGGEELNPQLQDQNLPCCRLHHPRMGAPAPPTGPPQGSQHSSQTGNELLHLALPVEPAYPPRDLDERRQRRARAARRRASADSRPSMLIESK